MVEVLTTGCFGAGLHPGHIQLFEFASTLGSLTVGFNGDRYTRSRYGEQTIAAMDKLYMLESIRWVSKAIPFEEDTPVELIYRLRPKYYVKGPDYKGLYLPEQSALDAVGSKLIICPLNKIYHNSRLHSAD